MTDKIERENPRTRRVRSLILSTCVDVLLNNGAHEVTVSNIAERADVARTTIYRHWPDQRSLLLATIENLTTPRRIETTTGPLDDDILTALRRLRERLARRDVRSVFGALAGHATQDDAFADAQQLFVRQLAQPMVTILEAAQERGELGIDVNCQFEANLLAGPILHQHLALHDEVTEELINEVAQRWLTANSLS